MMSTLPSHIVAAAPFIAQITTPTNNNNTDNNNKSIVDNFQDDNNESDSVEIENVRVVVRVRPIDKIELDGKCENIISVDKLNRCITVNKPNSLPSEPAKVYFFDNVFAEDSTQVRNLHFLFFGFIILLVYKLCKYNVCVWSLNFFYTISQF